jgi:8-oxo-dGTP pyrophosphatase MutT (NUDIX family)
VTVRPPSPARRDALDTLSGWIPPDDGQRALRDRYHALVAGREDALDRSGQPEHLTASALVLSADGGRVLLGLHRKVGRWLQMGGHLEPADSSLSGAAMREAREESGIDDLRLLAGGPVRLDAHPVRCAGRHAPERVHLDVQYAAVAPPGAVSQRSAESLALAWYPVGALPEDTDDSVRRLVDAALRRLEAT